MTRTFLLTAFLAIVAATAARADWLLTPYIGGVFGGASNQFTFNDADDEFEQRMNFGVSFGYFSRGIFGIEVDYSAAPNFFQFTGGTNNFDLFDLDSSVQTFMGNVVLALPVGWGMALATAFAFWLAVVALVTAARAVQRARA